MSQIAKGTLKRTDNLVINSAFELFQRTLDVTTNTSTRAADKFLAFYTGMGGVNYRMFKSNLVPSLSDLSGFASASPEGTLFVSPEATHTPVTTDAFAIGYRMEGFDVFNFLNEYITVGFMVRTNKPGIYALSLFAEDDSGNSRTYTTEFTVNASDVWQLVTKTIPIDVNDAYSGLPRLDNRRALDIGITLAVGPDRAKSVFDQWTAPAGGLGVNGSANQVNFFDSASNEFRISNFMVNVGTQLMPYRRRGANFAEELALAQRYFEKTYNLDIPPGGTGVGSNLGAFIQRSLSSNNGHTIEKWNFAVKKRSIPTSQVYAVGSGTPGHMRDTTAGVDRNAVIILNGETGLTVRDNEAVTVSNFHEWQCTADAEL